MVLNGGGGGSIHTVDPIMQTHHESHQQRFLGRLYSSYGCWQH